MYIQNIQNSNQTNFGASLNIHNPWRRMNKSVVQFLEQEFPKRTADVKGKLDITIPFNKDSRAELFYSSDSGYKDGIAVDFRSNFSVSGETAQTDLLDKCVNATKGFLLRENAYNKLYEFKKGFVEVADKAYKDSKEIFTNSFSHVSSQNRNFNKAENLISNNTLLNEVKLEK